MLIDYKDEQFVAYTVIKNSVLKKRMSHAYLIDANNYSKSFDFALSMAKFIFCQYNFESKSNDTCNSCHICSRIDNGNFPELKIIEADGPYIKKEQLLELQSEFNLSSIEGNYRIYIIKDCDKMNKHASNSLLKFLEEPVRGVVAILLTNHFSNILDTIVSRCQIIRLNSDFNSYCGSAIENLSSMNFGIEEKFLEEIGDEQKKLLIHDVIDFATYFEENKLDILIYLKKKYRTIFSSRESALNSFLLLIYLYYDSLKYKISTGNFFFNDYKDKISEISSKNSLSCLVSKLELLQYAYDMLKNNLNVNLLVDDIVIKLGDIDEYS